MVDASPPVPVVLQRVCRLLQNKVFHAQAAVFDGMDHLTGTPPPISATEAEALAQRHHLRSYDASTP